MSELLIELIEMSPRETLEALAAHRRHYVDYHKVEVPDPMLAEIVQRASSLTGAFPSKAISLLDAAMVRANLCGSSEVALEHIYLSAANFPEEASEDENARSINLVH